MDKMKKVILKQSLHRVCYVVKVVAFYKAFCYLIKEDYNINFWKLIAIYLLLLIAMQIWEYKDYSVRMYPYADDEEEYCDEELEDEEDDE